MVWWRTRTPAIVDMVANSGVPAFARSYSVAVGIFLLRGLENYIFPHSQQNNPHAHLCSLSRPIPERTPDQMVVFEFRGHPTKVTIGFRVLYSCVIAGLRMLRTPGPLPDQPRPLRTHGRTGLGGSFRSTIAMGTWGHAYMTCLHVT